MSRAARLGLANQQSDEDVVMDLPNFSTMCEECGSQPENVKYNMLHKLVYWTCPNGHKGWIEDFDL